MDIVDLFAFGDLREREAKDKADAVLAACADFRSCGLSRADELAALHRRVFECYREADSLPALSLEAHLLWNTLCSIRGHYEWLKWEAQWKCRFPSPKEFMKS